MPHRIDINNADGEDLEAAAGISSAEAEKVIEFRQTIGFFSTLEDLEKISGLSPVALRRLRARVRIG